MFANYHISGQVGNVIRCMWSRKRIHLPDFGEVLLNTFVVLYYVLNQLPRWVKLLLVLTLYENISHMMIAFLCFTCLI
jgi:hypothetical protein